MAAAVQQTTYNLPSFSMSMVEPSVGTVEYVPNPHFVFPAPQEAQDSTTTSSPRRTTSLRLSPSPASRRNAPGHKSVSALPTFSFNAADTSGRSDEASSESAGQIPPTTPKYSGHRRRVSEFVGGDARYGVPDLVSTSPITSPEPPFAFDNMASTGSPAKKRGHAHRRSAAISSHDLSGIMQPPSPARAPADSYSNFTGTDAHSGANRSVSPISSPIDLDQSQRPVTAPQADSLPETRPRVGFSEKVHFIPRPLSVIDSEAESSMSTPASMSARHSVSSIIDFGSLSPSTTRQSSSRLSPRLDAETPSSQRSSLELSRGIDKEGHWLRKETGTPVSELSPSPTKVTFDTESSQALLAARPNLDRRSSEPSLVLGGPHAKNRSSVSLQEPVQSPLLRPDSASSARFERRSSVKKVKAWATSIIGRREKDMTRPRSVDSAQRKRLPTSNPTLSPPSVTVSPSEEPDLEELFSRDPFGENTHEPAMPVPRIDFGDVSDFQPNFHMDDNSSSVIDLDAALGPNSTPGRQGKPQGFGARRQLHSSRLARDFNGPGGHYHRRTESAPVLAHFEFTKSTSPVQTPMADVFETEEEHDDASDPISPSYSTSEGIPTPLDTREGAPDEDNRMGMHIVDSAPDSAGSNTVSEEGLGIQQRSGRSSSPLGAMASHRSTPISDRRPSLLDESIPEEVGPVEIVEDFEEPRASMLTKSSDSSDTPTIMDHSGTILSLPQPQSSLMTPTTYAASTFSTPDFGRRQGSFEGSRLGTSASSMTDCRTMSSFAGETGHGTRTSVDDVPSLTSSRSTMISGMNHGGSRRDISDRSISTVSSQQTQEQNDRRRKRSSIQSLTKLVGSPFSDSRSKLNIEQRPQTSASSSRPKDGKKNKEKRLSRLMFWKNKTGAQGSSS